MTVSPVTAREIVGWYVDAMREAGLVTTEANKARYGKGAKALLDAGADPVGVRRAVAECARMNRPDLLEAKYGDWQLDRAGVDRAPRPAPRPVYENPQDAHIRAIREGRA